MTPYRILLSSVAILLAACRSDNVRPSDPEIVETTIECPSPDAPGPLTVDDEVVTTDPQNMDAAQAPTVTLETLGSQLAAIDARLQQIGSVVEQRQLPKQPLTPGPKPVSCPEIPQDDASPGKTLLGTLEWIWLEPPGRAYRARVDSGANTSSISAVNVREFERDGKEWVRFTFDHDGEEPEAMIERPVERVVLIRQVSSAEPERRPVVLLTVRLGELVQKTEFTLTDRTEMTYPVLLGREFLRDLYLIDVAQSYLQGKPKKR